MQNTDPIQIFKEMQAGLEPVADPGYLQYWETRAGSHPEDQRLAGIVTGLTQVALRGATVHAEYTNREPSLQARYWYRSLGPLNPMEDIEPDLITAARLMYGKRTENVDETANLQLDSAYALADLARVTSNPTSARQSLSLALGVVGDIEHAPHFADREAIYRIQTAILENDLRQDAVRLRTLGELKPQLLEAGAIGTYRKFEQAFAGEELRAIGEFGKLIDGGITEENFGILFEWYFLMARRHEACMKEELDTTIVRGATSRENAEWTGDDVVNTSRMTGNHDIVITKRTKDGRLEEDRLQLKAVKSDKRRYHPLVKVIDYDEALHRQYVNIDQATKQLVRNVLAFQEYYRDLVSSKPAY